LHAETTHWLGTVYCTEWGYAVRTGAAPPDDTGTNSTGQLSVQLHRVHWTKALSAAASAYEHANLDPGTHDISFYDADRNDRTHGDQHTSARRDTDHRADVDTYTCIDPHIDTCSYIYGNAYPDVDTGHHTDGYRSPIRHSIADAIGAPHAYACYSGSDADGNAYAFDSGSDADGNGHPFFTGNDAYLDSHGPFTRGNTYVHAHSRGDKHADRHS
jgi:hypothetical protein